MNLVPAHAIKAYGGMEIQPHVFLSLSLEMNYFSASCSGRYSRETNLRHEIGFGLIGH